MKKVIHRAEDRGKANHGWLKTHHSFSFAEYYDPEKTRFGLLRVLNDDEIAPGAGFGTHPHDNMEIITIPLEGSLEHKDSMGNGSIIKTGEVQVMSAGSGITHSEFNPSGTEWSKLFQIWIFPKYKDITPAYGQKLFNTEDKKNKFQEMVTPDNPETLNINQDAYLSIGNFDKDLTVNYNSHRNENGTYLIVIKGQIEVNGEILNNRDAIGIWETEEIKFKTFENSEILTIEVPMRI